MLKKILIVLGLSLACTTAQACVYDGAGGVSDVDPDAVGVGFATGIALNDGELAAIESLAGQPALQRSQYWLAKLREILEAEGVTGVLHIYLVEGGLWSSVSDQDAIAGSSIIESAQRLKLRTHTLPPSGGERVLIVSEAALSALVLQAVSLAQAQKLGIARMKYKAYPLFQQK